MRPHRLPFAMHALSQKIDDLQFPSKTLIKQGCVTVLLRSGSHCRVREGLVATGRGQSPRKSRDYYGRMKGWWQAISPAVDPGSHTTSRRPICKHQTGRGVGSELMVAKNVPFGRVRPTTTYERHHGNLRDSGWRRKITSTNERPA